MTVQLYPYQREAIRQAYPYLRAGQGFFIQHDPGLGKTLDALLLSRLIEAPTTTVVCTTSGVGVWARELRQRFPTKTYCILRGDTATYSSGRCYPIDRTRLLGADYYITNYEQLRRRDRYDHVRLRKLLQVSGGLLVLDESQMVKGPRSKTRHAIDKLNRVAGARLLLSGTPAHSPLDWWAQHRMIDPDHFPWSMTFGAYKRWIAKLGGPDGNWVQGWHEDRKEIVMQKIARRTHVATTADTDWLEPVYTIVPVELSDRERKAYDTMNASAAVVGPDWQSTVVITLTKYLRLHQITGGHIHDDSGTSRRLGTSKLRACVDLLYERSVQKVVVACRFTAELEDLSAVLARAGRPFRVISGKTPAEDKSRIEDEFQQSNEPLVLLLQYRAGGTSLTLTAARSLIIYSMDPSVINWRQILGRVWRIGQRAQVQVLSLLAADTVDMSLYTGLQKGLDIVDMAKFLREQDGKP